MTNIKKTLDERGPVHGNFTDNARISQEIKAALASGPSFKLLTPVMRESLDMIAHKMARIVSGDPTHKDHWHDCSGYATLVEERL